MEKSKDFRVKVWNIVDKALAGWSIFIMALMCLLVIISVVLRYVFNIAYTWSEELIVLLFISTTYFGSILCVKEKEHIDIPFLREKAPEKVGFIMDILVCIINIVVQIALAYVSIEWVKKTGGSSSPGLKIPYYYIYSLFPFSLLAMAIYTIRRLVNIMTGQIKENDGGNK